MPFLLFVCKRFTKLNDMIAFKQMLLAVHAAQKTNE